MPASQGKRVIVMIYRLVVAIPSEIFVEVDSLDDAHTFIEWISDSYDKVSYPIKDQTDDRTGIAQVKCLSIEKASENDKLSMANSTMDARDALARPTKDDDGPSIA